jgi:hypothetical protein
MKVSTDQPLPGMWTAIDLDRYDGAPDGDTTMGTGKTEEEAILDLLDKYEDEE